MYYFYHLILLVTLFNLIVYFLFQFYAAHCWFTFCVLSNLFIYYFITLFYYCCTTISLRINKVFLNLES